MYIYIYIYIIYHYIVFSGIYVSANGLHTVYPENGDHWVQYVQVFLSHVQRWRHIELVM